MKIDRERLRLAARSSIPVTITTSTFPHEHEAQLEEVLSLFLEEIGQAGLKDAIYYCLRELVVNGKKSNTKRVYFTEKGLDLNKPEDYHLGMKTFKDDAFSNIAHYFKLQEEAGFYVKIRFELNSGTLRIFVANNNVITRREQMRIFDRIARARAFNSLEEAFSLVLDDSEGAGLGIVIMILMLRKIGLDEDAFDIDVEGGETVARLTIPMARVRANHLSEVSELLAEKIDHVPQFPENVATLQRQLANPDVEMAVVARSIATDAGMTADLLKLVNSAAFMHSKRVDNIAEAVKLVGLKGLRNLLYSYGTQKILGDETPETKGLWEHCYKTAFYSYTIARSMLKRKDLLDDAYVGGILHDMGKLVFSTVHPELLRNIRRFCEERNIPPVLFEEISAGLNHAEIGAKLARKWNFPDNLVSAIRYHHEPARADRAKLDLVRVVYMANILANYQESRESIENIDPDTLAMFGIGNQSQLDHIHSRLEEAFHQEVMVRF